MAVDARVSTLVPDGERAAGGLAARRARGKAAGPGVGAVPALALLSGVVFAHGGAPTEWWACGVAGLVGLVLALEVAWDRAPTRAASAGAVGGLGFGVGANAVALGWSTELLVRFGDFPWPLAAATSALLYAAQAVPWAAAGALAGAAAGASRPLGAPALALAVPLAMTLVPAVFPWRPGVVQLPLLPFAQLAELGGEPLVDLASLGLVAAGVVAARRRRLAWGVAAALVGAAIVVWGLARMDAVREAREGAPALRVGVVQPNVPVGEKRAPGRRRAQLDALHAATRSLEARGAELVVWPETAHPYLVPRGARRDLPPPFAARGPGVEGPLLVGALTVGAPGPDGRRPRWNSALSIDRSGRVRGVSDKVVLVPFGERIPLCGLLPPAWFDRFGGCGLERGARPRALPVGDVRVGVLNCYEDVLGAQAAAVARERPALLVNVTNDAWFGDTAEPHLHLFVSRMRAIEARRDLVRSTNTGVSAHVLATGELAARTATFVPATLLADVRRLDLVTPWARLGDWVTPACGGALLAIAAAGRRGRAHRGTNATS